MMQNLSALWRRVSAMVGRGRVSLVDDTKAVQRVQVQFGGKDVHDDLPDISHYGLHSNPPIGTDAVALFINGERTAGVVIATNNQTYRLKGLASGEVALADDKGQVVYLSATGIRIVSPLGVLIDTPSAHFTGDVLIDGDAKAQNVTAVADVKDQNGTKTMAGMRAAYDSHNHADPQGGTTAGPSPGM